MAFIKFTESGRSFSPRATISTYGTLSFSDGARWRFSLDTYAYAILYYDPDTRRIGIELTNERDAKGTRKLRHRKTGSDMAVKPFLDYFSIHIETTTLYDIARDRKSGMLVIDLKTGRPRRTKKEHGK